MHSSAILSFECRIINQHLVLLKQYGYNDMLLWIEDVLLSQHFSSNIWPLTYWDKPCYLCEQTAHQHTSCLHVLKHMLARPWQIFVCFCQSAMFNLCVCFIYWCIWTWMKNPRGSNDVYMNSLYFKADLQKWVLALKLWGQALLLNPFFSPLTFSFCLSAALPLGPCTQLTPHTRLSKRKTWRNM